MYIRDLALQTDGRIVLAGDFDFQLRIMRLEADGSIDQAFGVGGQVVINTPSEKEYAEDVLVLPDGQILVGACPPYASALSDFLLVRLNGGLSIVADDLVITAQFGQTVTSSGKILGVDASEVVLTASIGTVGLSQDGTWLWNYMAEGSSRQLVVNITATTEEGSRTSTFTLNVRQPPSAGDDSFRTSSAASRSGNLLSNDSDGDGDSLVVTAINGDEGAVGQVVLSASGAQLLVNADGSFNVLEVSAFSTAELRRDR